MPVNFLLSFFFSIFYLFFKLFPVNVIPFLKPEPFQPFYFQNSFNSQDNASLLCSEVYAQVKDKLRRPMIQISFLHNNRVNIYFLALQSQKQSQQMYDNITRMICCQVWHLQIYHGCSEFRLLIVFTQRWFYNCLVTNESIISLTYLTHLSFFLDFWK